MADLMERLLTKDKECISKIYKRLKKYAKRVSIELIDDEGISKEARVNYLMKAYSNETILMCILSDIRLKEFNDFKYLFDYKCSLNHFGSNYWEEMGLSYHTHIKDGYVFRFIDGIEQIFYNDCGLLYKELGYRATINSSICAMTNLYGVIPFEKAYEIFVNKTSLNKNISYERFIECALSFVDSREDCNIAVYMRSFVSTDYVKISIRNGTNRISPLPSYYELISKQGEKPFYSDIRISDLLEFEDVNSYGSNEYITDFTEFLLKNFVKDEKYINDIVDEICIACRNEIGINEIFGMLAEAELMPKAQKLQKSIVCYIMEIKNNIRLRSNRGYSINEMRILSYDMDNSCCSI